MQEWYITANVHSNHWVCQYTVWRIKHICKQNHVKYMIQLLPVSLESCIPSCKIVIILAKHSIAQTCYIL